MAESLVDQRLLPRSLWAVSGAPVRHTDVLVRSGCKGRFRYSDLKEAGRAAEAYVV